MKRNVVKYTARTIALSTGVAEVAFPTVHVNGTSGQGLYDALSAVKRSLEDAYAGLKKAAPNGRDYYTGGNGASTIADATAQYMNRLALLQRLIDHIDAELEAIVDQMEAQR